ncbi:LOW QUALITY PROTEIN: uncharacterized protein [Panulirus ornatus]|uniref:LOW QUALITY PROTEIN: uncharacterized protein n=1 Tax=Panulirus ornatus TaxID=150431 RepID=UPI003A877DA8
MIKQGCEHYYFQFLTFLSFITIIGIGISYSTHSDGIESEKKDKFVSNSCEEVNLPGVVISPFVYIVRFAMSSLEKIPMTVEQRKTLVALISQEQESIQDKTHDVKKIIRKQEAWEELTARFNAIYPMEVRSTSQLKRAWEYIKKRVKREHSAYVKKWSTACDGPPPTPPMYDELINAAANIMRKDLEYAEYQYNNFPAQPPHPHKDIDTPMIVHNSDAVWVDESSNSSACSFKAVPPPAASSPIPSAYMVAEEAAIPEIVMQESSCSLPASGVKRKMTEVIKDETPTSETDVQEGPCQASGRNAKRNMNDAICDDTDIPEIEAQEASCTVPVSGTKKKMTEAREKFYKRIQERQEREHEENMCYIREKREALKERREALREEREALREKREAVQEWSALVQEIKETVQKVSAAAEATEQAMHKVSAAAEVKQWAMHKVSSAAELTERAMHRLSETSDTASKAFNALHSISSKTFEK